MDRRSGTSLRKIHEGLLSAFPSRSALREMLRFGMDVALDEIAAGNLSELVFELIAWAESHGRTDELLKTAYESNPGNPQLKQLLDLAEEAESATVWFGAARGRGSNRFIGRVRELGEIHTGLRGPRSPATGGQSAQPFVRLVGLGGAGKSLLAEEYARRFGAAYPGGVFWLKAFGHDGAKRLDDGEREVERQRQFAGLAEQLGISTENLKPPGVRRELATKLGQRRDYLWIVDDLPSGRPLDSVEPWMAPTPHGYVLVTTRAATDDWVGTAVEVDELQPDDAYALLTHRRIPTDGERAEAEALARDLGYHALGLELAAKGVERQGYIEFRRKLAAHSRDELDHVARLFEVRRETLPHRGAADLYISRSLLISIEALREPASMDFLRLAAQLAPGAISSKLVALALAAADGLSAADGEELADLAMAEVESCSLAQPAPGAALQVHTLVARTVRFHDRTPDRQRILRRAAADALCKIVQPERGWQGELASDVDHARTVVLSMTEYGADLNRDEARSLVGVLQQIYPYTEEGGALWKKVFEICCRVLGARDPGTLIAMNRRALWLYGFGDPDEALDMQERVFELSRSIRGEDHADTHAAIQNLRETLQDLAHRFRAHDPKACSARLQELYKWRDEFPGQGTGSLTLMYNPT